MKTQKWHLNDYNTLATLGKCVPHGGPKDSDFTPKGKAGQTYLIKCGNLPVITAKCTQTHPHHFIKTG